MVFDAFIEDSDYNFSCGYGGVAFFIYQIFRGWNLELGALYEKINGWLWRSKKPTYSYDLDLCNSIQQKIKIILNEYDKPYNEGMKIFLNFEGEITPKKCVLLLKAFGRVNPQKFEYTDKDAYKWFIKSFYFWQKMVAFAIENNKSINCG